MEGLGGQAEAPEERARRGELTEGRHDDEKRLAMRSGVTTGYRSMVAAEFQRRETTTEGWTGFSSQLRCRGRLRRGPATLGSMRRLRRRSKQGGNPLVHGDGNLPAGFGAKEPVAGVELTLAKPREATAQGGVDQRGGAALLEMVAALEREGLAGRDG
ncbi:hypothetical protein [Oryza sativa Japonica Group]|uniref:DUF834 domain-containing protein n=1 Tax=Oryza sativa subsp. japonica TaxID=39947 RepID=Q5VNL7_ORYSJ|nr:hypothetical protein [Oryza sativa Japonica Group]